jgi:uncharacterized membrane protein
MFICLLVLIGLATLSALYYVIIKPQVSKGFTEFFILDQNGKTVNYPSDLIIGGQGKVFLNIVNHEGKQENYNVEVIIDGSEINQIAPIQLADKASWQTEVDFTANTFGNDQNIQFLLFEGNQLDLPTDSLQLWFNVNE